MLSRYLVRSGTGITSRVGVRSMTSLSIRDIETRWTKLPECEQGAIADALAAKEKGDWKLMTPEEKRAAYFIAYGPYGARTPPDPSTNFRVFGWTSFFLLLSFGCWKYWIDHYLPKLRTTTPEWVAAQAQRAIEAKQNPHSGPYYEHRIKNESS